MGIRSAKDAVAPAAPTGPEMDDYVDSLVEATVADAELLRAERGRDFSFDGMCFAAKVVGVYDGDTIRVTFCLWGHLVQWRARMAGYDSPEMKPPKASPTRLAEKAAALAARDALAAKVDGQVVAIKCGPFDKYGRVLVTVFAGAENINEWMVAQDHGVPYDGGTKKAFAPHGA